MPKLLWEATLDPEICRLPTDCIINEYMGNDAPARFNVIMHRAKEVNELEHEGD